MTDEIPTEGERMTMPIPPRRASDTQAAFDLVVPELLRACAAWMSGRSPMDYDAEIGELSNRLKFFGRRVGLDTSIIDETLKEIADG